MFITRRLLQPCRITLFTREGCGLCSQGKGVLSEVWDQRPFKYTEVEVDAKDHKHWRDLYDFDVPVVRGYLGDIGWSFPLNSIDPYKQRHGT